MRPPYPSWIFRLFSRLLDQDLLDAIEGDLIELFEIEQNELGTRKARARFFWRAIGFLRPAFRRKKQYYGNQLEALIRHSFTYSRRSFLRHKASSLINISGLVLGLTSLLFLSVYLITQWTHNRHFDCVEDIYRVDMDVTMGDQKRSVAVSPAALATILAESTSGISTAVSIRPIDDFTFTNDEGSFHVKNVFRSTSQFFNMFSFKWLAGDQSTALSSIHQAVVSQKFKDLHFPEETNVLGKIITDQHGQDWTIMGVFKNPQLPVDLKPAIILSQPPQPDRWGDWNWTTYIKIEKHSALADIYSQLEVLYQQYLEKRLSENQGKIDFALVTLPDTYFVNTKDFDWASQKGDIVQLQGLALVGLFILVMTVLNYTNTINSRIVGKIEEYKIRRVFGASRRNLLFQFAIQSTVVLFSATVITALIVSLLHPAFAQLTGINLWAKESLTVNTTNFYVLLAANTSIFEVLCVVIVGIVIFIFIPAFSTVFVATSHNHVKNALNSSWMVSLQFSIALFALVGTGIIFHQLQFLDQQERGFSDHGIVIFDIGNVSVAKAQTIKNELSSFSTIEQASFAEHTPGDRPQVNNWSWQLQGENKTGIISQIWVDENFLATLTIPLLAGRALTRYDSLSLLVNEQFCTQQGISLEHAIGLQMTSDEYNGTIVGVVSDFHMMSLHHRIEPMILRHQAVSPHLIVSIHDNAAASIPLIQAKVASVTGTKDVDYGFLDRKLANAYTKEKVQAKLLFLFSLLLVSIAALGVWSNARALALRRTKEFGIRKIHGATDFDLILNFSRRFILILLVSMMVVGPTIKLSTDQWLDSFAYHADSFGWVYLISFLLFSSLVLSVVGWKGYRLLKSNPIESLRDE
jgi:putative ABC transport system permease protein